MARKTAEEAEKTRGAILDAALASFAERGYAATQLEQIARSAAVTRGALYHHFVDKAELFLSVLRDRWTTVMSPVLEELEKKGAVEPRMRAFIAAFLRMIDEDPRARALMKMSTSGDTSLPEFAPYLDEKLDAWAAWRAAIASVLAEAKLDHTEARAAALLASLIGYAVVSSLQPPGRGPRQTAVREAFLRAAIG